MKTRAARPSRGLATGRVQLRVSPIEAACAAVLSAAAGAASAQVAPLPTPSEALETVVVTDIRHAIEDALAVKRQSDNIVEVVSAEDIGKLPDINIADSISRHDLYIRTSAAETVARPRMDDLRSNITAGVSPIERTWSGSGGNPLLQPWRANACDVSFEKYFSEASYVGIAGFYNKIM